MSAVKQTSAKNIDHVKMDHESILHALLQELQQGVIVCAPDGTITLFNKSAAELFDDGRKSIKNGTSFYSLCLQSPVEHALDLLHYREKISEERPAIPPHIQFINASTDQKKFLRCRLSLLESPQLNDFFMVFLEDVSAWYKPDNLFFMKIDEFRAPMTNLRAAVENLTEHPEMSPVMRSAFENVLVQESLNLTEAFDSLDKTCNHLIATHNHLIEISSTVLFAFLANHFTSETVVFTVAPGQAGSVKVDSYGLLLVLEHLAEKVLRGKKLAELHCKAHTGEQFIYFDFFWTGKFMPTTAVESLLQEKISKSVGNMNIAAILHSMGGDIWSQQHDSARSILRLALPLALKPER